MNKSHKKQESVTGRTKIDGLVLQNISYYTYIGKYIRDVFIKSNFFIMHADYKTLELSFVENNIGGRKKEDK